MEIELKGFVITSNDTQLHVQGPDDSISANIGRAFLDLMKTQNGLDLIEQYIIVRTQLIQALNVPTINQENPTLDNISDWLSDHPDWIVLVEDALEPHGYIKLNE